MRRKSKSDRPPSLIRQILSANLVALRDLHFAALPTETARNKELARASGTTLSQVQRIIRGELGVSIDGVESLARALKALPSDLLRPYFAESRDAVTPSVKSSAASLHPREARRA